MGVTDKAIDVVVDQIKGYIEPSAAERTCAYELFVVFNGSVADGPIRPGRATVRAYLDGLEALNTTIVDVLRKSGRDAAKGTGGNLSLSVLTLRVVGEVVRPAYARWQAELTAYEAAYRVKHQAATAADCEATWPQAELARTELRAVRSHLRQFQDTLARIAGVATGALQSNPPSVLLEPTTVKGVPPRPGGAAPQKDMVRWLGLRELVAIGRARRRVRAASVSPSEPERPTASYAAKAETPTEFVFDYVADLGDGFDATMAVAWHLGRQALRLPEDPDEEYPVPPAPLPRGRLLVLGGDEVYPSASSDAYRDRTVLPYTLAWEEDEPDASRPVVVAIPGNHDWLGGIGAFDDVFVKATTFATHWDSPQDRRCWAVELPHGWWLWGIDTRLDDTLPDDQHTYFKKAATWLRCGDQVMVCTPVPLWQLRQRHDEKYRALRSALESLIVVRGASIPVWVSGDSHFFAHYQRVEGRAPECHITAGGGGAFLQPTHNLPDRIPHERGSAEFVRTAAWPGPADSRALTGRATSLRKPYMWWLVGVAALLHAGYQWLTTRPWGRLSSLADASGASWRRALAWSVASPWSWCFLAAVIGGGVMAVKTNSKEASLRSAGKTYGAALGALLAGTFVVVATLRHWIEEQPSIGLSVVSWLVGGVLGVAVFFWFVSFVNERIRANDTLTFATIPATRFKHFLRFRIDSIGAMTCYAIGLDPVGRGWDDALRPGALAPPPDAAGLPRLHYIWGRRFEPTDPPIKVTVSISRTGEPTQDANLDTIFRMLCRRLIEAGHFVLYGGKPRYDLTLELAEIERRRHQDAVGAPKHLLNYVAGYLWRPAMAVENGDLELVHVQRPDRPADEDKVDCQVRDLTALRERLTHDAHVRVCIGGRIHPDSPGTRRAPGIIEEAALSITHDKPLIVAGGFGGASKLVADALLGQPDTALLSKLSASHLAAEPGTPPLGEMINTFDRMDVLRNPLTNEENEDLLTSRDPAEVVDLVMRAVRTIARRSAQPPPETNSKV